MMLVGDDLRWEKARPLKVVRGAMRGHPWRRFTRPMAPPSIREQATRLGASLAFINGSALSTAQQHYNATLTRDERGRWLIWRNQERGDSTIHVTLLFDNLEPVPEMSRPVPLPVIQGHDEQWEDPRAFRHNGQTWLSYTSWKKHAPWAAINVVRLDDKWRAVETVRTEYGGNWSHNVIQKNWAFFSHEGQVAFVYLSDPHEIVVGTDVHRSKPVRWGHGVVRGGSPPVLVGDRYVAFFHSSLLEGERRRYHMGAYSFAATPPFTPLAMTPKPLLSASEHDRNLAELPLVVFPCGALHEDGRWIVSIGVNDCDTAIMKIDDAILAGLMEAL